MLKSFICPNLQITDIDICLKKCPFGERCAPISFLRMVSDERKWTGTPSVTQLIRGTRESYLKITKDYSESPQKAVFRIIGTQGHKNLEKYGVDPEHPLIWEGITGTPDDIENENGEGILIDNKVSGSYKVAQALGIEQIETGEFDKKGKPKKDFIQNENMRNFGEWILQFNMYRIMVEEILSIQIKKIKAFLPVRDGDTFSARSRGVFENFYYIDVPFIEDEKIKNYFRKKRDDLLKHLSDNTMPELCSPEESWNGNKCKKACSVVQHCINCSYLES